jgi:hypothetical protein
MLEFHKIAVRNLALLSCASMNYNMENTASPKQ